MPTVRCWGFTAKCTSLRAPDIRKNITSLREISDSRCGKLRLVTLAAVSAGDQWYPEAARCMVLMGADILLYPTAIGSEPRMPGYDSSDHWRRVQAGHAAANVVPVCASNRIGTESDEDVEMTFFGRSFITDETGALLVDADRETEGVWTATFDFEAMRNFRSGWGFYRDRRPQHYAPLLTQDGTHRVAGI